MSSSRSNTSGPGMTETRKPIAIADHDPLVLGAVDTSPPSNSQPALSPGAPPLPPRRTSPFSDSGHAPTTSPAPPVAKQVASDVVIPIPASGTTDESDNQTTNITPSRSTRPGPPALPPRPQSIKRLRSDLTVPLIPYNPWSAFKDDFMDSAALAARDRILIDERERKNRQEEYELERQRIVPGLDNSDLIALLRSFDKQVYNVHLCPEPYDGVIPHGLDLQPNPNEEFTVDKMRSCLERVYSSIIVGLLRFVSEVQRIRKWEEGGRRTIVALVVCSYAWIADLIITSFLLFLATLVLFPSARKFCFAPPLRAKHPKPTSNKPVKVEPPEAPHRADVWGPAASEDKAADWADTVIDLMKATALPKETTNEGVQEVKDTADREINGVMVKDMKKRGETGEKEAKEKSKKELAIDLYGQPAMRVVAGLADKWERIANALNPTPPFALEPRRVEVFCYMIAPLLIVSTFITERMVSKAFGIIFGFLLFGQPVIDYILEVLNQIDPAWKEKLILENNILSDVPTNAQLILRLLRDAEHRQKPLQRPMSDFDDHQSEGGNESKEDDEDEYEHDEEDDEDEGADSIAEAISGAGQGGATKQKAGDMMGKVKSKVGARAKARKAWDKAGHFKEEGFALLSGHKKLDLESRAEKIMDRLSIHKESKPARAILDRLPRPPRDSPDAPSRFYVYHPKHGPGHIIIYPPTIPLSHSDAFIPARVRFTTVRNVPAEENVSLAEQSQPSKGDLVVSINDVVGLKKHGASWPTRIATSWALDVSGAGGTGLEVKFVRRNAKEAVETAPGAASVAEGKEESIKFNGIVRRNELFDRLLSAGEQRWEMF